MEPAYEIPLDNTQLAILGELTAILGQIDDEMVNCVAWLIRVNRNTANAVMGSTKISANSEIWSKLITQRTRDIEILWLVDHAKKEIEAVSKGRNDFVHAVFESGATWDSATWDDFTWDDPVKARRVRNMQTRPVSELSGVRDQAARLSCLLADISYRLGMKSVHFEQHSPWLERLSPTLPPRPDDWAPQ